MDPAWEQVYANHYSRLVALLTAIAGSAAAAEESVQEAFVRALGLTGRRRVVDDPQAWLYRVAVNHARSRWRRLMTARRHEAEIALPEAGEAEDERYAMRSVVREALARLPWQQREVLALYYIADMPIADIAARTDTPVGTVKARLARGRDGLRRELESSLTHDGGDRG